MLASGAAPSLFEKVAATQPTGYSPVPQLCAE